MQLVVLARWVLAKFGRDPNWGMTSIPCVNEIPVVRPETCVRLCTLFIHLKHSFPYLVCTLLPSVCALVRTVPTEGLEWSYDLRNSFTIHDHATKHVPCLCLLSCDPIFLSTPKSSLTSKPPTNCSPRSGCFWNGTWLSAYSPWPWHQSPTSFRTHRLEFAGNSPWWWNWILFWN